MYLADRSIRDFLHETKKGVSLVELLVVVGIMAAFVFIWLHFFSTPKTLVFAGRVSRTDQKRWLNDRLVILYSQDIEIGRAKTLVSSFGSAVDPQTDGVFEISVDNIYSLKKDDIKGCKALELSRRELNCWLGDVMEDASGTEIDVPQKKVSYSLKWLPGDYASLPEEMKESGVTGLSDGNIVIINSESDRPASWLDKILGREKQRKIERASNLVESVQYDPRLEEIEVPSQSSTSFLNNCQGTETVHQTLMDSKTFVREYTVQLSASLGVPGEAVELQLGARGGYHQKQISTKSVRVDLPAAPGTNISYSIRWKEVWQKGTATIRGPRGLSKVPFRLRKDLKSSLDTTNEGCGR